MSDIGRLRIKTLRVRELEEENQRLRAENRRLEARLLAIADIPDKLDFHCTRGVAAEARARLRAAIEKE